MIRIGKPGGKLVGALWLAGALVITGALAGCGGAPVVAQAKAEAPRVGMTGPARVRKALTWQTFRDPMFGFSVALPEEPFWVHSKDAGTGVEQRGFHVELEAIEMDAILTTNGDNHIAFEAKEFADRMRQEMMVGSQLTKGERGGVSTYELSGKNKSGGPMRAVVAVVGADLLTLAIQAERTLDDAMVERFFDSMRVERPWHIEAFADGLTVALPPEASPIGAQTKDDVVVTSFVTNAAQPVWFGVSTKALVHDATAGVSTETLIDSYVKGISRPGVKIKRQTNIDLHGIVGREVISTIDKTQQFRTRIFVSGSTVYVVAIGSENADAIMDAAATRVLDSIRLRPSP